MSSSWGLPKWMSWSSSSPAKRDDETASSPSAASTPKPSPQRRRPSRIQMMREGYESLICAVIRPPRSRYSPEHDLGPNLIRLDSGIEMARKDFSLKNQRGLQLQCSIWLPVGSGEFSRSAVVYLHGNSSCRVDATRTGVLETVAPLQAALVSFDFAGSGLSDGEHVTLGWHEHHDVATVVGYLRDRGFEKIALWGRSMGAVSALMFAQSPLYKDMRPAMVVLDSPFSSFTTLVDDLIKKGAIRIPSIAVKTVLSMVRSSVKKRTGADIYRLEPIKNCPRCEMPALFITGDKDEMIPPSHGNSLESSWGGPSLQIHFHGGHNSPRPPHIYDSCGIFLRSGLTASSREPSTVEAAFASILDLADRAPSDLPPGWLSATDPESGETYYYDTFTQKTTWFRPYKPSSGFVAAGGSGQGQPKAAMEGTVKAKKIGGSLAPPGASATGKGEFGEFAGFGDQKLDGEGGVQGVGGFVGAGGVGGGGEGGLGGGGGGGGGGGPRFAFLADAEDDGVVDGPLSQEELAEFMEAEGEETTEQEKTDTNDAAGVSLSLF